jgi:hypothetical protein
MVTCLWSATTGLFDSRTLNKPGDERDVSAFMEDCRVNVLSVTGIDDPTILVRIEGHVRLSPLVTARLSDCSRATAYA